MYYFNTVDQHTGRPCIDFLDNPSMWNTSYTLSSILLTLQVRTDSYNLSSLILSIIPVIQNIKTKTYNAYLNVSRFE